MKNHKAVTSHPKHSYKIPILLRNHRHQTIKPAGRLLLLQEWLNRSIFHLIH